MKNYFSLVFFTLLALLQLSDAAYYVGSSSLQNHGIYEIVNTTNRTANDYYCQKYQPTVFDDSSNPVTLSATQNATYSQSACVKFFVLQLDSTTRTQYINVDVKITDIPSDHAVFPLFSYKIGSPPLMKYDTDNDITFENTQFDFNGNHVSIDA